MKPAEITSLGMNAKAPASPVTAVKASVQSTITEEPNIVKVAKLGLILASKDLDTTTKRCCVKAAYRMNIISNEECTQLMMFANEFESFADELKATTEGDKEDK